MDLGPDMYGWGVNRDLDPLVLRTLNYWMTVLSTCTPSDYGELCQGDSTHNFYEGNGGIGDECGYVPNPPIPRGLPKSTLGIIIGSAGFLCLMLGLLAAVIRVQKLEFSKMKQKYLDDVLRPQKVRLQMFLDETLDNNNSNNNNDTFKSNSNHIKQTELSVVSAKFAVSSELSKDADDDSVMDSNPIADMFPQTTILMVRITDLCWTRVCVCVCVCVFHLLAQHCSN